MPLTQLGRPAGGSDVPRAELVHRTSQALADLAAHAEGRARRAVPVLAPHGAGDQLAVLGADVLASADAAGLAQAHEAVLALRRAL
ncbi:hypothetical protein [Kineococcus rubinsiae]|uniref:hypothetical protein n=1 Tax=Kineococcus rubinsiae TaxID=2609562 RepID=UPI0014308D84|nr:hypothetical protein [Kineococcus rubinsiae]NIZ93629.1 hypothetical protein [Kineococcus rubinsiae]